MNNKFITITPDYKDDDYDFWKHNMQLSIMQPFSSLYDRDESSNKNISSKEMVVIFFMCDPDEEENLFYRIPFKERLKMLKETYYADFNERDELIKECMALYPHRLLNAVKRALKEEIDSMVDRGERIRNFDYENATLEEMMKMDKIRGMTLNLAKNYEQIESLFLKGKNDARVRGGRKESKVEKRKL